MITPDELDKAIMLFQNENYSEEMEAFSRFVTEQANKSPAFQLWLDEVEDIARERGFSLKETLGKAFLCGLDVGLVIHANKNKEEAAS